MRFLGVKIFFRRLINFKTTSGFNSNQLTRTGDYLIWYGKDIGKIKYRQLYLPKIISQDNIAVYKWVEEKDGSIRKITENEVLNPHSIPKKAKIFRIDNITSQGQAKFPLKFQGEEFHLKSGLTWKTHEKGMYRLIQNNRILKSGKGLAYKRYLDDFPVKQLTEIWDDTITGSFTEEKRFVVHTNLKVIERCILMTTDPGDLILDPTCGSGTSAYSAEKWGRRWVTIDTSRIALNIAKNRILTGSFPYYQLYDELKFDIRQGFKYEIVKRVTLGSIANLEEPHQIILYDKPIIENYKLRVAGPFTVETLQNFEPASPSILGGNATKSEDDNTFENRIFEHLKSAGVKNGIKNEQAVFIRVETLADSYLHAEGFYKNKDDHECKAYFHIGPKFGTVAKKAVNEAIKACRQRGDADWLIILGFSFESDIANQNVTMALGSFEVTKVRMHDDLMQEGLLKKDKKAASFVTIGEPDIKLHKKGDTAHVEIRGLDIYDPIKDQVKARNVEDIAYWMLDDDYDGSNFVVKQVFFCGGKKDEFKKWRKGLDDLAKRNTKRKVEKTLKIEIDDEAFDRLYGFESHPFEIKKGQKVAVRVISQFGEESTKVLKG